MIQLDFRIFFKGVGSTTNQIHYRLVLPLYNEDCDENCDPYPL